MELDVVALSRLQFALTIMFHYLFPPLTIGLGWLMVFMEGMYLKTGDRLYESIARFWTGIFAVVFAMGVATGIVMEFQFGTNWAVYSRYVGDVFGSALAAEGIFAFFLESGFLAVLVFGWDRVSPKMHFFSTVMVAVGALFSAVWIVVANSWQQTPAGYEISSNSFGPRAVITDFWQLVFNPSSVHRLIHVYLGALILGSFFVLSIASWYLLKRRHEEAAKRMFKIALWPALAASLIAPISGDLQARMVSVYQPAKLAAFEALYKTTPGGSPLYLFGWPDDADQTVHYGLAIPKLLSVLVHHDLDTPVTGLDQFPREDWPPVNLSFQTYHLMVALGMGFIGLTGIALFFLWRGSLFRQRWLLWIFVFAVIGPFIANEVGWAAAEVGRQPWIVYGLMRTSDAVSEAVSGGQVLGSIAMFGVIYSLLFLVWVFVLNSKIQHGPEPIEDLPGRTTAMGLLDAASRLADHEGSMTEAHEGPGADTEKNT
ncbi:MAG: cytochrome ubiquinol oxidase subunit I [FCB group bacterium]|jgi:cytochrome d ubiquinol oxidase subunit I|nr:cytochrome ubiquinol oxidase subunit I [FCB group bacterium]